MFPHSLSQDKLLNKGEHYVNYYYNIALYKGLDAAIMRQFVYCGVRLGLYKMIEDHIKQT